MLMVRRDAIEVLRAGKAAGRNTGVLSAAASEFDFAFFPHAISLQPNMYDICR